MTMRERGTEREKKRKENEGLEMVFVFKKLLVSTFLK